MNLFSRISLNIAVSFTAMFFISASKPLAFMQVDFQHFVGNSPLQLDSLMYTNEIGQSFSISKLKYYISNIRLKNQNGKEFISKSFFLIDEREPESKHLILHEVPTGTYTSISFTLGVDSLHNCSGAQDGALDPVNGMFWEWKSGYVFLKLEGKSSYSTSPGHLLEFHIGGYRQPSNCIREISLKLSTENRSLISIKADASEILKTPTTIDFSKLSSITDFHNATSVADNYIDMFSIIK